MALSQSSSEDFSLEADRFIGFECALRGSTLIRAQVYFGEKRFFIKFSLQLMWSGSSSKENERRVQRSSEEFRRVVESRKEAKRLEGGEQLVSCPANSVVRSIALRMLLPEFFAVLLRLDRSFARMLPMVILFCVASWPDCISNYFFFSVILSL